MRPLKRPLNYHSLHPTPSTTSMSSTQHLCYSRPNKCHILQLPLELQILIFTECISHPFAQLMDGHHAPQVLLSVCKDWRTLVYGTPSLWSSFEACFGTWALNYRDVEGDADQILLSRMKSWLHRSGNYALSVRLAYEPPMPFPKDRSLSLFPSQALTLLLQHCSRWRHIELSMPSACLAPLLQGLTNSNSNSQIHFPLLETLVLNPTQISTSCHRSEPIDVQRLVVNCGQLTKLHINLEAGRSLTLGSCRTILSQNPNLTNCTLYVQCTEEGLETQNGGGGGIFLPALVDFHLMVYSNQNSLESAPEKALTRFLSELECYQLKSLQIEWFLNTSRRAWTSSHPAFVSFLVSLRPTLEDLRLGYLPLSEAQLIECLEAVPFLTSLNVRLSMGEEPEGPVITDAFWKALTCTRTHDTDSREEENTGSHRDHSPGTLLPCIQSMYLQCHGCGCSERELVKFVDSRAEDEIQAFRTLTLRTAVPVLRLEALQRAMSEWHKKGIELVCT